VRNWEVLNDDLLELLRAAGVPPVAGDPDFTGAAMSATDPHVPVARLRRNLSTSSDTHLLAKVRPPFVERDVDTAVFHKEAPPSEESTDLAKGAADANDSLLAGAADANALPKKGAEDEAASEDRKVCGYVQSKAGARMGWVDEEVRTSCRRSSDLLARLLAHPAFVTASSLGAETVESVETCDGRGGASTSSMEQGRQIAALARAPSAHSFMRNRSLQSQLELLKDQLDHAQKQAEVEHAATLQAQTEAHHAMRQLDLFRASTEDKSYSATPTTVNTTVAAAVVTAPPVINTSCASPLPTGSSIPPHGVCDVAPALCSTSTCGANHSDDSSLLALEAKASSSSSVATVLTRGSNAMVVDGEKCSGVEGGVGTNISDGAAASQEEREAREDAEALAGTRLKQLEATRLDLKKVQDQLTELRFKFDHLQRSAGKHLHGGTGPSSSNYYHHHHHGSGGDGGSVPISKLEYSLADLDRERAAKVLEQGRVKRMGEDLMGLQRRCAVAEAKFEEWKDGAGKVLAEEVQEAQVAAEMARAELAGARARVAEVDTTNEENRGLKAQVEEYAKLLAEERRRQASSASEAKRARLNSVDSSRDGGAADCSTIGAELESQKLMNEELMKELEANAKSLDELTAMNTQLLQQNAERDDVNRVLMTKARQLREVKNSEAAEREAMGARLQHAEAARVNAEELLRAKDRLVEEAAEQRRTTRMVGTEREREASHAVEQALVLHKKVEALKEESEGHKARSDTAAGRLTTLSEECRQLRATRDELEEALEEKVRRLDRSMKKLEKEKGKTRKSEGSGSGSGKEMDEDAEYRECLEFENDELKKIVSGHFL
jgi:DNA repair exonuclease SbcCD ATPase subunit